MVKEVTKEVVVEKEIVFKLKSKEFKEQIDKFSKENAISKRQARKKIFLANHRTSKTTK